MCLVFDIPTKRVRAVPKQVNVKIHSFSTTLCLKYETGLNCLRGGQMTKSCSMFCETLGCQGVQKVLLAWCGLYDFFSGSLHVGPFSDSQGI